MKVAAFDYLLGEEGDFTFLEYNTNCGWAWFESAAKDESVSKLVYEYFQSVYRQE